MQGLEGTRIRLGGRRVATGLAVAALLVLAAHAAAAETRQSTFVRTYDIRLAGSVTTTAPDIVFTEQATHTYKGVRIRVSQSSGRVSVGLLETRRAADRPNGVMSGEVVFQQTGAAPCGTSKQFRGPARVDVFGSSGRAFYAAGDWEGPQGGASLSWRDCRGLLDVAGDNLWLYEKGRVSAQLESSSAAFAWLLPIQTRGRLPFPLNLISAGKSFNASATGSFSDGFGVRQGTLRVTFTAR